MRALLGMSLLFGACQAALCQPPAPGFPLTGIVLDPSNAGVSGAKVALKGSGAGEQQTTAADAAGGFRFEAVLPGSYEIQVQHEGFKPATVRLRIGSRAPAPLKIALAIADMRQEVTVGGQAVRVNTNTSDNLDVVTLDRQSLDNLPIFDQDYVGAMTRFLDAGAVGTGGVTLLVDGLEATRAGVSASAIQEVKINQNPYSAEFSRPGRGRIEILTKPGSQEYHGAFNFLFRDYRLNARDPFALARPVEQRRIFEGNLTGPVARSKRTSFLISANREEEDSQSVVFALAPSGPVRENVPSPARDTELSASVNHRIGETHLISLRGLYTDRSIANQGVGGFNLPEVAANFEDREDLFFLNHQGFITPKLLNQFRMLLFGRQHTTTRSLRPSPKIVVLDAFTGGGAQADRLQTENHIAFNDFLTWTHGGHTIKFGINVPDISRRGLDDDTSFRGTYSFSTIQDYLRNRPFSLLLQQGEGHVVFLEKVVGGFIQDEFRVRSNLQITSGLRYDWQNYFHDNNNFSPRLSFAFAPGQGRKTVLRGGAGLFHDRTGPGPIFDLLRYDGRRLRRFVIGNPKFPDPLTPAELQAQPTSVTRLDPAVKIPYTVQYSFGVERQLQKSTTLTVTYLGTRGVSMFRSRDINAPPPPLYLARPDPALNVWRQIESSGHLESHSLEVGLRGNVTRFFNGMIQYALGRVYNDTGGSSIGGGRTSGINTFPANNYDLSGEWARADFDQRRRFNLLGTFRADKYFNLGMGLFLNTGEPYSMTTGRDDNHDGLASDRPPGVRRNSLQGPGYAQLDLRWSRDFFLVRSKKDKGPTVTFALDGFNVLNRVNYVSFVGNLSSPFFGRAVAARPPRRLQLSVRFKF
jgi:hypothetical protein